MGIARHRHSQCTEQGGTELHVAENVGARMTGVERS